MSEDVKTQASPEAIERLGGTQVPAPGPSLLSGVRYHGEAEGFHAFSYGDGKVTPASMLIKIPLSPGTPNLAKGRKIIINGAEYRVSGSHSRGRITVKKI